MWMRAASAVRRLFASFPFVLFRPSVFIFPRMNIERVEGRTSDGRLDVDALFVALFAFSRFCFRSFPFSFGLVSFLCGSIVRSNVDSEYKIFTFTSHIPNQIFSFSLLNSHLHFQPPIQISTPLTHLQPPQIPRLGTLFLHPESAGSAFGATEYQGNARGDCRARR